MPRRHTRPIKDKNPAKIPDGFSLLRRLAGNIKRVHSVVVAPDGQTVICGSDDHMVRLWNLESDQLPRVLEGHIGEVTSLAVTPDGRSVLSGSADTTVRIWDLVSGQLLRTLKGHSERVTSLAVTPDGRSVLSGSTDKLVRIWDFSSGRIIRTLNGHTWGVNSVAVTPDGRAVLTGSGDKTVRIWDLKSGRLLRTLEGHTAEVGSVRATADGKWIVSTSDDFTIRLWDAATGQPLRTLEGHTSFVPGLALTGHLAATESFDGTARVWDLSTGRCLATLEVALPGFSWDNRVAFTPDGAKLLTVANVKSSDDEFVAVWNIDWARLTGSSTARETVRYRNAKVVLVGDTGVGKSGLAAVLAGKRFHLTESTHGRKVWLFESKKEVLADGEHQTREVMLWDLAGQPGYRLVHQLNIDQTAVALVRWTHVAKLTRSAHPNIGRAPSIRPGPPCPLLSFWWWRGSIVEALRSVLKRSNNSRKSLDFPKFFKPAQKRERACHS